MHGAAPGRLGKTSRVDHAYSSKKGIRLGVNARAHRFQLSVSPTKWDCTRVCVVRPRALPPCGLSKCRGSGLFRFSCQQLYNEFIHVGIPTRVCCAACVRARTGRFTLIFVRVCVDPCVALAPRLLVRAAVWAGSPPTGTDIHTRLARG
jgi:hypothetical protein